MLTGALRFDAEYQLRGSLSSWRFSVTLAPPASKFSLRAGSELELDSATAHPVFGR